MRMQGFYVPALHGKCVCIFGGLELEEKVCILASMQHVNGLVTNLAMFLLVVPLPVEEL